ncbi:Protein of unknown function (DUF563) [Leishmania donovani]|uniref:Glycosyltransferase 61 catalytic domain-containing protein n=2 Tax=Leishmania donovani TaxID=5661 RepID=A0A6J8F602_LEIDO|nr:Protein of unknown function (DUF563) [Leishmania donovani]VDZ42772.1 Protein_of_unknown_function_(DUF563)_putative/Pfam:PF04577 [Leishmania donovani]
MTLESIRKRGAEESSPVHHQPPSPAAVLGALGIGSLRHRLWSTRRGLRGPRSLSCVLIAATICFFICCVILSQTQVWGWGWYGDEMVAFRQQQEHDDARRRFRCPLTEALVFSAKRSAEDPLEAAYTLMSQMPSTVARSQPYAFGPESVTLDGGASEGHLNSVEALTAYCAARVAERPSWRTASWQQASASNASAFRIPVSPRYLANASYAATGSPVCLRAGRIYLTDARIRAGIAEFQAAGLTVLPLTDDVLSRPSSRVSKAAVRVVPAMAVLLNGAWIATHFFHLVTDALEALRSAYQTWQDGVLLRIPTQTVLLHQPESNWMDRRGDTHRKMELSAALANAFSSPELARGSPYNSSFLFRSQSRHCAELEANATVTMASPPPPRRQSQATASTLCFCDGLLVTTHRLPVLERDILYGIQDWVARQFRASPYGVNRSVQEMERLRLQHAWLSSASTLWSIGTLTSSQLSLSYKPRALFVHRTSRVIANASRYAGWMRAAGFRVEEVYLEKHTAAQQYHLGRYADIVVGMHGLGIGHALWMERSPPRCRAVIEFRPWVIASMPTQPVLTLEGAMQYHFVTIPPIDVRFGPSVAHPAEERELLLSSARMVNAFRYPSFTDQIAIYDDDRVKRVIADVRQHLERCLPP